MDLMNKIRNLIFDMDGVLWHGSTPMPDLPGFFAGLKALGIGFVFATNNASKSPEDYVARFRAFGVEINPGQIMTSGLATAAYLAREFNPASGKIYVVGTNSLRGMIRDQGFEVLPRLEANEAAMVVVAGLDPGVTYDDFAAATLQIRRHGAIFIGCNPDATFPSEQGLLPGNGALIALLRTATDVEPVIIGKPQPGIFQAALERLPAGATAASTAMVGDRLGTDILGGRRAGRRTIQLLCGVSRVEEIQETGLEPDYIFADIHALLEKLSRVHQATETPATSPARTPGQTGPLS